MNQQSGEMKVHLFIGMNSNGTWRIIYPSTESKKSGENEIACLLGRWKSEVRRNVFKFTYFSGF